MVVRVDADNEQGPWDGRSWKTACRTLQEAIDAAEAAGGGEVWVAKGVYKPTAAADRDASIRLKLNVHVYGGFQGTETRRDERDWELNPTVLSGDVGRPGDDADNSFHVVIGAEGAVLDGFTITGGNALDGLGPPGPPGRGRPSPGFGPPPVQGGRAGGPIHTDPQSILGGAARGAGGGMVNFQCAPTVRNCLFRANKARKGGAMYNMVSSVFPPGRDATPAPAPEVTNCAFLDNYALARGGAVSNDLGTSPTFSRCRFINNATDEKGGAIYNDFGCCPIVRNCLFVGNRALRAGAIGNDGASSPSIVCSTFTRNRAEDLGAALYQGTGPANNPLVDRSIFWDNLCDNGPAEIVNWHDCEPVVTGSCVRGGYPGEGNIDADPRFVDPAGGDYRLAADSPCPDAGFTAEPRRVVAPGGRPIERGPQRTEEPQSRPSGLPRQAVVYVDFASRASRRDGKSWQRAFTSLQEGIDYAWGCGGEVWVARGTYQPTDGTDRSAAFRLRPGVHLYGGFRGSETRRLQRDIKGNVTVLSGDVGRPGDASDNCYHVVIGADAAVLDGFTITGGHADGQTYDAKGGGMINYRRSPQGRPAGPSVGYSPIVRNCTFVANEALEGGAMYNYDRGTIELTGCTFTSNVAQFGGAVVDRVGVATTITACAFIGNRAQWRGGALYFDYGSRPTITFSSFQDNVSACHGGAIYALSRASQLENTAPTVRECEFVGNRAAKRGGAVANADKSILTLTDCTLVNNHAGTGGGALANDYRTQAVLARCTFDGNMSDQGQADVDTDATSSVDREDQ